MILLLGATGHIGRAFAAELRKRGTHFTPLTRSAVDYTRFETLFDYIHKTKPEFVVNAAGIPEYPGCKGCDADRVEAVQANTLLPQTLARVCYLTKTPWGHVSSGNLYSGALVENEKGLRSETNLGRKDLRQLFDLHPEKFRGFAETAEPNNSFRNSPCSFYSGTKALAEEALCGFDQCLVWRPRIIFDEFDHPQNFLSYIQNAARVFDGASSFSHRGEFVSACIQLWNRRAPFGVYNIVNPGAATPRQIGSAVTRILGNHRKVEYFLSVESPDTDTEKVPPSHGLLDSTKLLSAGVKMRPLREALEDSLKKWQQFPQNDSWLGHGNNKPGTKLS